MNTTKLSRGYFLLPGIDISKIIKDHNLNIIDGKKYGGTHGGTRDLSSSSDEGESESKLGSNITFGSECVSEITPIYETGEKIIPITNLYTNDTRFSKRTPLEELKFHNEARKVITCQVIQPNLSKKRNKLRCWNDHHIISEKYHPIGCPTTYYGHQLTKEYSAIHGMYYIIKENVADIDLKTIKQKISSIHDEKKKIPHLIERLQLLKGVGYVTVGAFCSFDCCYTHICKHQENPLYVYSKMFLNDIYHKIYEKEAPVFIIKDNLNLLEEYGGNQTIEQWREELGKVKYVDYGTKLPDQVSISSLYQKQITM